MKASELRIGNLANYKGEVIKIEGFSKTTFYYIVGDMLFSVINDIDKLEPIQLTGEWLLKLGFEQYYDHENDIHSMKKHFFSFVSPSMISVNNQYLIFEENNIKYVHQIQNLYFALTSEELTIK